MVSYLLVVRSINRSTLLWNKFFIQALRVKRSTCCTTGCCCWKCGNTVGCCSLFCSEKNCQAIQPLKNNDDCNYFELLEMPMTFSIDPTLLENNFKMKQKKIHPDLFATKTNEEQIASSISSSTINQAYQVLKKPTDRAQYLLKLKGINVFDENSAYENPKLMIEMFELREAVDELESLEDALRLDQQLGTAVAAVCDSLQMALDKDDLNAVSDAAVRLKYLSRVQFMYTAAAARE